jgi:hypothetical protein
MAVLVLVGFSLVILKFGEGSPIPSVLSSEGYRRLITGAVREQSTRAHVT